ncbi:septum site-determining protein MinC [Orrella sp. NBD-18]|uniref:Probable septum site-determining protein MinC n=1 Tax=Sheuella amnicola TaxID=2707330 RepID=A0A6B2R0C3_9BURK|nr:septum site-determining protein MinC [Sheuella amnicola]NDY83034.1 septum site-determining protein MinC [Sheuella amnicola]
MTTDTLALDFKSATLYAVRVVLQHADTDVLLQALQKRMAEAGSFFEDEPVVIDASRIEEPLDWPVLIQALRDHRLPVIGVVAQGDNLLAAQDCGLTLVDLSGAPARAPAADSAAKSPPTPIETPAKGPAKKSTPAPTPASTTAPTTAPSSASTPASAPAVKSESTMVVNGPLRSGQRIYARNGDLIVMGLVSQGAEVIADGNIHIYGPLRGKAMAGARGDSSARIFTTGLDAELVAVAGVYRVIDSKLSEDVHQRPALVQLEKEALQIKPLDQ